MTGAEIFIYGACGAMAGAFIVQLLPIGYALASGKTDVVFSWGRVLGALIIVAGLVIVGGLAALGLGSATGEPPTEPLEAIAYGFGWQSTIGGLLNAKSAATTSS